MPVTKSVSIYDAKSHLSALIVDLEREGGEITITRHGRPVAQLVPAAAARRRPAGWKSWETPEGWDEFTAADQRDWYGE
ncbi:MAG: type II toxin-antitoxin system prevent-host-death family antitoxin [Propionibacteriaceae bacterium]|nr:type II toxin-antitoxin system prevent-host-death family antitoxin [Propionibacteriaceae bacterium]